MERRLEQSAKSISSTPAPGALHQRGAIAAFVASAVMTVLTTGECNGYYNSIHLTSSLAPLVLFASLYWLWWGFLAVAIWWVAAFGVCLY